MKRHLTWLLLLSSMTVWAQQADFTLQKNIQAGKFTPLCLPVKTTTADFDELFAVGGIDANGVAQLYPVGSVEAGVPFVARIATDRNVTTFADATVSSAQPNVLALPWQGGMVQGDYASGYTWQYTTLLGNVGSSSQLQFEVQDLQDMNFDVTLENLNVRQFFAQNRYTFDSPSVVERYNVAPAARRDIPNPVLLPVPAGTTGAVTVSVGTAEGLDDAAVVEGTAGDEVCAVFNLIPQRTYYYKMEAGGEVVSKGQFHTTGHLRMIYAPSISNIRDLGGWPTQDGRRVRYGRLFRGGELNGQHVAAAEDLQTLKNLGVSAEIDLRWSQRPEENLPWSAFGFTEEEGTFLFVDGDDWSGSHLDTEATKEHLRREFELIFRTLRAGGSVYYHCVWGADRTGLFSLVLESVLGLTTDSFFKDFELTTFSIAGLRSKNGFNDRPNYFNTYAGATLSDRACNYLRTRLGISQEDIDFFLETMLE